MKIVENLFNPVLDGIKYDGFLNALNTWRPLNTQYAKDDNLTIIDTYIFNHISDKPLKKYFTSDNFSVVYKYNTLYNLIKTYDYELNGLYNSTLLTYNPISNYDMTETHNIKNDKSKTLKEINTSPTGKETATHKTSANDTNTLETAYTDSVEYENKKTTVSEKFIDTSENSGIETTISELNRSGNIGVTTTQQMIESERRVLLFNFAKRVCEIVEKEICLPIWENVCKSHVYDFDEDNTEEPDTEEPDTSIPHEILLKIETISKTLDEYIETTDSLLMGYEETIQKNTADIDEISERLTTVENSIKTTKLTLTVNTTYIASSRLYCHKVGKLVFVQGTITTSAEVPAWTKELISGLPTASQAYYFRIVRTGTTASTPTIYINNGGTTINVENNALTAEATYYLNFCYIEY